VVSERAPGIDRVPLTGWPACIVSAADLKELEDLLTALTDVAVCCSPQGVAWDDKAERAEFFAEATEVWERTSAFMQKHGWD
jgi:hypothetical protein